MFPRGSSRLPTASAAPPGERPPGRLAEVTAPSALMMWSDSAGTSTATATAAVHASTTTYLVDLRIGTQPLALTVMLGTGSRAMRRDGNGA